MSENGLYDAAANGMVALLSAGLAYTVAVWRKPSHKQLEVALLPLKERLERLELQSENHITRMEFKDSTADIKAILQEVRADVRQISERCYRGGAHI